MSRVAQHNCPSGVYLGLLHGPQAPERHGVWNQEKDPRQTWPIHIPQAHSWLNPGIPADPCTQHPHALFCRPLPTSTNSGGPANPVHSFRFPLTPVSPSCVPLPRVSPSVCFLSVDAGAREGLEFRAVAPTQPRAGAGGGVGCPPNAVQMRGAARSSVRDRKSRWRPDSPCCQMWSCSCSPSH